VLDKTGKRNKVINTLAVGQPITLEIIIAIIIETSLGSTNVFDETTVY